ncbi:MAG: PIN domain-containing protein [Acidimicrobiia bacterium]|nr:PIN domain-containing protein [Acidimicrobiia bacterium]
MLLADTSAWIEFLIATGSAQAHRMREAIAGREVVVIDPILLEVMAGAQRESVASLQRLLVAQHVAGLTPRLDWLDAARIYREFRLRGEMLRSQMDALIAAVAIRLDVPVLHRDRDFDTIAQHTSLRIVPT